MHREWAGPAVCCLPRWGIRQPYDSYRDPGGSIVNKMRMILIPLTVVAAIVVMAMTRRPGKARARQGR
jgi:hypothetical protein